MGKPLTEIHITHEFSLSSNKKLKFYYCFIDDKNVTID